jgi:phosphoglycolate phosphatase
MWGSRIVRWVRDLAAQSGCPDCIAPLYSVLGFDPETMRAVPDGPVTTASTADIYALAAGVLFQHGLGWYRARPLVVGAAETTIAAPPQPDEIRPLGDVTGAFRRLRAAGLPLAVHTNDDRALTQAALEQLGIAGQVAIMACGDDDLPPKPDPAGLRWIAAELGTTPERLIFVGDSAIDMLAARNAGTGAIGLAAAGASPGLQALASALITSIDELQVVA